LVPYFLSGWEMIKQGNTGAFVKIS